MKSTSWVRQLKARFSRPAPRHAKRSRARLLPLPERLERRVLPAFVITPTFDSTITSDPNATTIEASINRVIQSFEDSFSDNITVNITFKEVTSGLGGSNTSNNSFSYTAYRAALVSHSTTADDTTALASLPSTSTTPVGGSGNTQLFVATGLQKALGLASPSGSDGTINLNTLIMNPDRTLVLDNGDTTAGSNVISGLSKTASLSVGFPVVGAGIPGNTENGNTTNGSNSVTGLSNVASLAVGESVAGSGIPLGTTIAGIGPGSSITLSNNATATSTSPVSLIFTTTIAGIGPGSSITLSNKATATATAVSLQFGQDPNKYDLMDTTAHEIDEVLGMGSSMDGQVNGATANSAIKPLDLFRYSGNDTRSYDTLAATVSYFSIDGGATNLVGFNQFSPNVPPGNTPDFGDWFSNNGNGNAVNAHVQDSNAQAGQFDTLNVELRRMDVLGFSRITTAAPSVTAPPDQTAVEGATATLNLGNLSATSPNAPWGVTVAWGDGSTSPMFFVNSTGSLGTLTHTYAEEGSYTVSVTATDFVSQSGSATFKVAVSDPAVTVNANSGGTLTAINEATATPSGTVVGTFTDTGNPTGTFDPTQTAAQPEYVAVIKWGDGKSDTVDSFNNPSAFNFAGGGTFKVRAPAHTYAEEGSDNISLTVTHETQSAVGPVQTATITVNDPPVTVDANSGGTLTSIAEGQSTPAGTIVGTFTDTGNPSGTFDATQTAAQPEYVVVITWGNGFTDTVDSFNNPAAFNFTGGGTFQVLAPAHTYGEEGTYNISLTVTHDALAAVGPTQTASIVVTDPPVLANSVAVTGKESIAFAAPVATFTDPGGAEPNLADPAGTIADHYTATTDWGDGTPPTVDTITYSGTPGSTTGVFTVTSSHTFAEEGTFNATTVIDHEGIKTTVVGTSTIRDNFGLLVLDTTSAGALTVSGNGSVTVTNSGAVVVDSSSPKAIVLTGNSIVTATEADVGLGGGFTTSGHATLNLLEPEFNQEAATPDPIALPLPPVPTTHFAAVHDSGGPLLTLAPGTYDGGIQVSGKGSLNLLPGVYYMNGGGFSVSGQGIVTGTNVLIVNAPRRSSDTINFSGQAIVNLTASAGLTGANAAYNGITIFQDPASAVGISVTGQASLTMTGVLYAPKALLTISGNGNTVVSTDTPSTGGEVIVFDTTVTGNGILTINADPPTIPVPISTTGTLMVNAGSSLTASHLALGALVIGGTAGNPATVTIAASDGFGNPLVATTAGSADAVAFSAVQQPATSVVSSDPAGPSSDADQPASAQDTPAAISGPVADDGQTPPANAAPNSNAAQSAATGTSDLASRDAVFAADFPDGGDSSRTEWLGANLPTTGDESLAVNLTDDVLESLVAG
jgi:PKD domain-containing protein